MLRRRFKLEGDPDIDDTTAVGCRKDPVFDLVLDAFLDLLVVQAGLDNDHGVHGSRAVDGDPHHHLTL